MTRAFKKFGQALFLAIVVLCGGILSGATTDCHHKPRLQHIRSHHGIPLRLRYYGPGYYRFSSGNSLDNSPAYYSYGLGFPVNGSYSRVIIPTTMELPQPSHLRFIRKPVYLQISQC